MIQYIKLKMRLSIIICNNIEDFKEFPKNINYRYYINEANKIIYALKTIQTSLFDNETFN